jgi:hypothetical protein
VTLRAIVSIGVYASLVPLLGATGTWSGALSAAPFVELQAPGAAADVTPVHAARLERRDAAAGLRPTLDAVLRGTPGATWAGWTVPAVARQNGGWSHDDAAGRCVLDEDGDFHDGGNVRDATTAVVVLVRATAGVIDRVAFTDAHCPVDAGDRTVFWLDHVDAADSANLFAGLVRQEAKARPSGDEGDHHPARPGRRALPVLALHDAPPVDVALLEFVDPAEPEWLRRDAAFWLGVARGASGAAVIDRLARHDGDSRFREHLTFVLTLTGQRGLETLLDLARHDPVPAVRGQALFWLSQKAGQRATATLASAVNDDPNSDVRRKAVFAISQLPSDESVPRLIDLARTHRDPEVRKQAMFWLGQSRDPRALAFFESVLKP